MRRVVAAIAALVLLWPPAGAAWADPAPAEDADHALGLATGWLARQVTADGQVVGLPSAAEDLVPGLTVVRALAAVGPGEGAADRIWAATLAAMTERGLADLAADELAALVLAALARDTDPRTLGPDGADLVAALEQRIVTAGVDEGRIGGSIVDAVPTHALAVQALVAAGASVAPEGLGWLQGQQCPTGGWPTYRDPASRQTGTCELLVPTMTATAAAATALATLGAVPDRDVEPFLRAAHSPLGAFAPAPGLMPSPAATAAGVAVIAALTGAAPDSSWQGTAGGPLEVAVGEQLGCGWHGLDRGGFPDDVRDAAGTGPVASGTPGVGEPADVVARIVLALGTVVEVVDPTPRPGDPFPDCPVASARAAGADRVGTAVALSAVAFPDGAPAAVLATAVDHADALAAAALAGRLGAPVLLTSPQELSATTAVELDRLAPGEIVLMGGEAALSPTVATAVMDRHPGATVRRVAGPDRFATAAAAAEEVPGGRVFLARGVGPAAQAPWADALSVGAWSASRGIPVLLTARDALPAATIEALEDRQQVVVVGGTGAVSAEVEAQAGTISGDVTRIAGPGRTATSAAVLHAAHLDGVDARHVVVATAADFPDALAAGPAAAALGATLLLVDPGQGMTDVAVRTALLDVDFLVDAITAAGGTGAVAGAVLTDAAALVREGIDG